MRVFIFLLIVANLLFFSWTAGYFGVPTNPDALRVKQQLVPERIVVISRDEPPPVLTPPADQLDKPGDTDTALGSVAPVAAAGACLQLAGLPVADADKIEGLVASRFASFKTTREATLGAYSYWVYIPPQASKKEAEVKASELKEFDVSEFFIVQESGPNNLAISLGLFSSSDAAEAYLKKLRAKGVRSARVTERVVKAPGASLEMRGPESQLDALRGALVELLPDVIPATCKLASAA